VPKDDSFEIWEVAQGSGHRRVSCRPEVLAALDDRAQVDRWTYRDPNHRVNVHE
jgi:hypothetical protein